MERRFIQITWGHIQLDIYIHLLFRVIFLHRCIPLL